jgi:hypothetical protein
MRARKHTTFRKSRRTGDAAAVTRTGWRHSAAMAAAGTDGALRSRLWSSFWSAL